MTAEAATGSVTVENLSNAHAYWENVTGNIATAHSAPPRGNGSFTATVGLSDSQGTVTYVIIQSGRQG